MNDSPRAPILTLEPLIDAVRAGVEEVGWELSGLQKTTSHEFEGRWKADSSRSAYLFFHRPSAPDWTSVDVFLDETSDGLTGNLALVLELRPLGELGAVDEVLSELRRLADATLPRGYRTPVTVRFRLDGGEPSPEAAGSEARVKLRIARVAIEAGPPAVAALCGATVKAFEALLGDHALRRLCSEE
jgi:hypothetical protein